MTVLNLEAKSHDHTNMPEVLLLGWGSKRQNPLTSDLVGTEKQGAENGAYLGSQH